MVQFLEKHFERVMERAALYRTLATAAWSTASATTSGRCTSARSPRSPNNSARPVRRNRGPGEPRAHDDGRELGAALRDDPHRKPTPAHAARLVTRFLQGALAAYSTYHPRIAGLFNDEWREVLDREAKT